MELRSANFGFLAEHDPVLERYGALAEHYFALEPHDALIKLRQLAGSMAQLAAVNLGLGLDAQGGDVLGLPRSTGQRGTDSGNPFAIAEIETRIISEPT